MYELNKYGEINRELQRLERKISSEQNNFITVGGLGCNSGFVGKVVSNTAFNVYNIQPVTITNQGVEPSNTGDQMQAYNLAEDFTQPGNLTAGGYVIVIRIGRKNVFYLEV